MNDSPTPSTPLPYEDGNRVGASSNFSRPWTITNFFRIWRNFALYLLLAALLYFALRNAPLHEIWYTLRQLQLWQIAILFGLNLFIYALITLRWWIIVRAENKFVAYVPLLLVRIAVFGVSYFTLGPHVGGEPLQV